MSYTNPSNNNVNNDDIVANEKNRQWYSSTSNPTRDEEGLYEYCSFCLYNFRQFNNMVNNVCQSCGRVAEPIMKDKEENLRVTSLNASRDVSMQKAVSIEFDYSPLNVDPTLAHPGQHSGDIIQAGSAGDAIRKINTIEQSATRIAAARLRNERYIVKTNVSKDKDKVLFDSNS